MSAALPTPDSGRFTIDDGCQVWSAATLQRETQSLADVLRAATPPVAVCATLMDNSPAWWVADQAIAEAAAVHVPLPLFFSAEQRLHALQAAAVDGLLLPPALAAAWPQAPGQPVTVAGQELVLVRLPARPATDLPAGTRKITFTSGTTGAPKGVCLDGAAMQRVAEGLVQAMAPLQIRRHLNALPFAVLLEDIAGLMAPRLQGATCITLPLQQLGLTGSSSFDPARFNACVDTHQPHSVILLPQMLRAWAGWLRHSGRTAAPSLKLVAVGGAAVGAALIGAARAVGIPAYEGYGLSEGASVQTLNLPGSDRPGSAGRPLPHCRLRFAADGEIEVAGSLFSGYLGCTGAPTPSWWASGDLGHLDADGFLHVQGRKKHVLITGFGRNVSPEWVETALRDDPRILQAVVFGDDQPALSAVLWPLQPDLPDAALASAVQAANAGLPDYARIARWVRATAAFDPATGLATANGRPQRQAIWQRHADALSADPLATS